MSIRIYIAGPITGIKDYNKPEFDKAEELLSGFGLEVVNPLKNGIAKEAPWVDHMKTDIPKMLKCEAVYALKGWHNSKGARAEIQLAEVLDMPIFEQCDKDIRKLSLFLKKAVGSIVGSYVGLNISPPKFPHQTPDNAYKLGQAIGQTEQSKGLNQYAGALVPVNKAVERELRLQGQAEAMYSLLKSIRIVYKAKLISFQIEEIERIINVVDGV